MNFPDTVPGDRLNAESAARYNAVNALLRAADPGNNLPVPAACRTTLTVDICNVSESAIAAYTPVTFTGKIISQPTDSPHLPGFEVIPATDSSLPWGIAAADIAPETWGTAVISGAVPAHFARNNYNSYCSTTAGDRVIPTPAGLLPHADHGATVLCPAWTKNGIDYPGVIVLGDTSPGYTGAFAVSCVSLQEQRFAITAGSTEFPELKNIPATEFTATDIAVNGYIMLVVKYSHDDAGTVSYSYEYKAALRVNDNNCFAFKLAQYLGNGKISQLWHGDTITMPGWVL